MKRDTKKAKATKPTTAPDEALGKALDGALLKRIFSYTWPYRRGLLLALALLPIAAAFELGQPYLLKIAIVQACQYCHR